MCNVMDLLDEAQSRACIIWLIGEHSSIIDNAGELLELFVDTYHDEKPYVQLQLLTASIKLFLKCPEKGKNLVTIILTLATAETLSVDIRDRAFLLFLIFIIICRYWRLLSSAPETAKRVVLAVKPPMALHYEEVMDDDLLYTMLEELGSVSSVYYQPAESFIHPTCGPSPVHTSSPIPDEEMDVGESDDEDSDSDDIDIFGDMDEETNESNEFDDIFE